MKYPAVQLLYLAFPQQKCWRCPNVFLTQPDKLPAASALVRRYEGKSLVVFLDWYSAGSASLGGIYIYRVWETDSNLPFAKRRVATIILAGAFFLRNCARAGHYAGRMADAADETMRCPKCRTMRMPLLLLWLMNSTKLVIPLHSSYWSIHTKDESKCETAFAFIFGVNWLWHCSVTASFGVSFSWNIM